mmetsp:Transcript_20240/g.32515  ORF Transcript_20240/g.32515 Transcript_20240/m.32515 type:complete len:516 (+) Transcript_20240:36-1583(+)|eukprot:jgi/Bigna1/90219/estExt_fgenesh1_pg.C_650062
MTTQDCRYYRVHRSQGITGLFQKDQLYLRVTAAHFELWDQSRKDGSYELRNIIEVKRLNPPNRIRIFLDTYFKSQSSVDLEFSNEKEADIFKDTLALNQDKDLRERQKNRELLRGLRKKYIEDLAPMEREVLEGIEGKGDSGSRRKGLMIKAKSKSGHNKNKSTSSLFSSGSQLSHISMASFSDPSLQGEEGSTVILEEDVKFPVMKIGNKQFKALPKNNRAFLMVSLHKLLYNTKHVQLYAVVFMSIIGTDGVCRSSLNQSQQLRFSDEDDERIWDSDDCTFRSWDCSIKCGDTLKFALQITYQKSSKEKVKVAGTATMVLGLAIENYGETDIWLDFKNDKGKHVAYLQSKIRLATPDNSELSHVLSENMKWGVKIDGRKEEKLLQQTPLFMVTLVGAVNMADKTLLHMQLQDKNGKPKGHLMKSDVHNREDQFGTDATIRHWGCACALNDQLLLTLVKRRGYGESGKPKGTVILREGDDYKSGYTTSLWVTFQHKTYGIDYESKVLVNIKYVL